MKSRVACDGAYWTLVSVEETTFLARQSGGTRKPSHPILVPPIEHVSKVACGSQNNGNAGGEMGADADGTLGGIDCPREGPNRVPSPDTRCPNLT